METYLSRADVDKSIIRLALPAIVSNVTVPLLGLSDTWISGHLGSEVYLAAIAVGTMMVNSLYWLLGFLRAGTSGLTAEAFGRKDSAGMSRIFTASFLLAVALGLVIMLLSYPLMLLMLKLMSPEPETANLAAQYFMISIFAAPALLATMTVSGWMIGSQNTLYPMTIAISVNVLNILLSMGLIFYFHIGFYGVAVGTLTANWIGLGLSIFLAMRMVRQRAKVEADVAVGERTRLWSSLRGLRKQLDLRRFFTVNSDLMMRSACIMAVTFAMTSFGGRMGNLTLAANAILMQMFLFFSYFSDGFAYAAEALCGRFAGASDGVSLRMSVKRLCLWCGAMGVVFFLLYLLFTGSIASFITDETPVVKVVESLRWAACAVPLVSAAAFLFDGVYIGLTATRKMLYSTLAAMILFFLTVLLPDIFPIAENVSVTIRNNFLWIAFLIFLAVRGILLGALLPGTLSSRLKKS